MEVPRTSLPTRGILSGGQAGEPGRLSHTTTFRERALARNVVAPLVGKEVRGTSIQDNSQTLPHYLPATLLDSIHTLRYTLVRKITHIMYGA